MLFVFSNLVQEFLKAVPEPEPEKINLKLLEPSPELKKLFEEQQRLYADSNESTKTDDPDPETLFEGAENTKAASLKKEDGNKFMPSTEGLELPGQHIVNREKSRKIESAERQLIEAQRQETTALNQQLEKEKRFQRPRPKTTEILPLRDEGLFRPPNKTDLKDATENSEASPSQVTSVNPQRSQQPSRPATDASIEIRASKLRGAAEDFGKPSFAISATSKGAYITKMFRAIEYRWKTLIDPYISLHSVGAVAISFDVTADGVITNIQVISGDEHYMNAQYAVQSIREVGGQLPPFPEDMIRELHEDQGHADSITVRRLTFSIYSPY